MSEHVWVVQVADYDNQSVMAVARTLEGAVAALKAEYGSEHAAEWSTAKMVVFDGDDDMWPRWYTISAHFERRPGLSTDHTQAWDIQRHELH